MFLPHLTRHDLDMHGHAEVQPEEVGVGEQISARCPWPPYRYGTCVVP